MGQLGHGLWEVVAFGQHRLTGEELFHSQVIYVVINPSSACVITAIPSITLIFMSFGGLAGILLEGGAGVITINNTTATAAFNINHGITVEFGNGIAATAVNLTFQTITTATTISGELENSANNTVTINANQVLTVVTGVFSLQMWVVQAL